MKTIPLLSSLAGVAGAGAHVPARGRAVDGAQGAGGRPGREGEGLGHRHEVVQELGISLQRLIVHLANIKVKRYISQIFF